jgi:hypothetical protein
MFEKTSSRGQEIVNPIPAVQIPKRNGQTHPPTAQLPRSLDFARNSPELKGLAPSQNLSPWFSRFCGAQGEGVPDTKQ